MNREETLNSAKECVCNSRRDAYGTVEDNFERIARLWSAYLDMPILTYDVACMMIMLKIARIETGAYSADNWIDIAGYAACGGEVQGRENIANIKYCGKKLEG